MTEDEAIKLIQSGGSRAQRGLKNLYETMGRPLMSFFMHRGVSEAEAAELLQETMFKVFRGASELTEVGKARSWIWAIARNELYDHLRHKRRTMEGIDSRDDDSIDEVIDCTSNPAEQIVTTSLADCVSAGLNVFAQRMPERAYALTLVMKEMSIEEIGARLGRTAGATKEYLSQCRKKLQPFIGHCNDLLNA